MRTVIVILAGLLAAVMACSSDDGADGPSLGCTYPDATTPGDTCVCFDGDLRCHPLCPTDLSQPCTPGASCADFSGGSAGQDCGCTCSETGAWVCTGFGGETCIPM